IVAGHQRFEDVDLRIAHEQPEELRESLLDRLVRSLVGDVLVHRPGHQPMEVLGCPLVSVRDENRLAGAALVDRRPALDHPPPDPSRGEHEVERPLAPRVVPTAPVTLRPLDDLRASARGALPGDDLDATADPKPTVPLLVSLRPRLSDQLAGAGV